MLVLVGARLSQVALVDRDLCRSLLPDIERLELLSNRCGAPPPAPPAAPAEEGASISDEAASNTSSSWAWGENHRTAPVHPLSRLHPELSELFNPPSVRTGRHLATYGDTYLGFGHAGSV